VLDNGQSYLGIRAGKRPIPGTIDEKGKKAPVNRDLKKEKGYSRGKKDQISKQ